MRAPAEIYALLSQFLDFRAVARLSAVCRDARKGMQNNKRFELGSVHLSLAQAVIRDAIIAMPDNKPTNVFTVLAPMGFGKTIVGLSIPFADPDDGHRYLFIVHPAAFDTWVAEVIKVFGSTARSLRPSTQILFAHSSNPSHNARAKQAIAEFSPGDGDEFPNLGPKVRIAITTNNSALGDSLAHTWATRAILDEAHVAPSRTWRKISALPWIVALSANIVHPALNPFVLWRSNGNFSSWVVTAGVMQGVVPTTKPRQIVVAPWTDEDRQFGDSQEKKVYLESNLDVYIVALVGVFATIPKGHVVLYLPDGDTSEELVRAASKYAAGWHIIEFNRAVSKIRQFEVTDRSILIVQHAKSVAVNIHATHLIVVRPDWVNSVRYAQIVGRVLRPLSPTATVDTFLIVPRGIPALRAQLSEALRMLATAELHLEPPGFSALEFLKADACLAACGSSAAAASPIELLAALGMGLYAPTTTSALFARWSSDPVKTLTEPQLRSLLGVPPAELTNDDIDDLLGDLLEEF